VNEAKPFCIPKREVMEAYKRVKSNKGAAGVDGQSLAGFEEDWKNNLFKIWNRMSSGSYFPPPVRRVAIPKDNAGTRPLGIPTVADRIAQTVVKRYLEPILARLSGFGGYFTNNPCNINARVPKVFTTRGISALGHPRSDGAGVDWVTSSAIASVITGVPAQAGYTGT
jgi:hypothetical protein